MLPPDLPFHQWLRQLRKSRDLTQHMFAQQAGCAVSTIRKLEHGVLRPSRDLAIHLAQVLKLEQDEAEQFVSLARGEAATLVQLPQLPAPSTPIDGSLTSLPSPVTPLLGRDEEVEHLVKQFADTPVRLLTLTGPGGVGKTRLAIRVGERLRDLGGQSSAEVIFVPLTSLDNSGLVIEAIARALEIQSPDDTWQHLIHSLHDRRVVLILDNLEHLLDAVDDIADLLHTCPFLRMLVTSRSTLGVYGEHVVPVAPLPLLEPAPLYSLDAVAENAACKLFIQRAQAANPAFSLNAANAATIVAICRRLDGLPLALELAATRARLLSAEALLARLSHPLDLLTTGARTVDKRHQTLRGMIEWSYNLLDDQRKALFSRLALFAGGFDLAAIRAICYHEHVPESLVLDDLHALVGNSLVQQKSDHASEPRFYLLEVLRAYARERLFADGSAETFQQQHVAYYRRMAQAPPEHKHNC